MERRAARVRLEADPCSHLPNVHPRPEGLLSWLASFFVHTVILVVLALVGLNLRSGAAGTGLTAWVAAREPVEPWAAQELALEPLTEAEAVEPEVAPAELPRLAPPAELSAELGARRDVAGLNAFLPSEGFQRIGSGWGLGDRSLQARAAMAASGGDGGPSGESEEAVERGLRWLVAHQLRDGSWDFDHQQGLCQGLCRNPGTATSRTAATAMALLAFLGAGYTHQSGEHRDVVRRGLYSLQSRGVITPQGIDLQDGTMYGQGLAAVALCEAYAMTGDPSLRAVAQGAIDFVVYAQDQEGGGWRYRPHQPGDTTVTGWQIMALKSGQMAGLYVPLSAFYRAQQFLTQVQSDDGAQYGYMSPRPGRTTTAIGLLCRMFAGWGHQHPGLQRGVAHLARWGPSETNIYYNYYATQVMFHWRGSDWKRWNRQLRAYLVATQAGRGHEAGSWYFPDKKTAPGGRLCSTALAIMTLEVYYRYLPLYDSRAF